MISIKFEYCYIFIMAKKPPNLLVTGGTGFIGSHFLNTILPYSSNVLAIRRKWKTPIINLRVEPNWITLDLNKLDLESLSGFDTLVHFAAHSVSYPFDTIDNCIRYNLNHPLALFEKARKAGVERFIVAGSCFEYGSSCLRFNEIPTDAPLEPLCSYGASKASFSIAIKQWALEHKLNLEILRIFHVYGEGESPKRFWPSLRHAAENGLDFTMTRGEQIREFLPVIKVAKAFALRASLPTSHGEIIVFNLSQKNPQRLKDFAQQEWLKYSSSSNKLIFSLPYRPREMMRCVPGPNLLDISSL